MVGLIVAGEAIFALPFHLARFFRPTVLEVFGLTNTELGAAQGVYGVLAMVSYFIGGPLADRFAARKLLAVSLWITAAGGLYMATFPNYAGAVWLWGFFGVSTILFFWAALIRATRDWGGSRSQGRAYGLLDAGRGMLAAVFASLAVAVFGFVFPEDAALATFEQKADALRLVIYGYTGLTAISGLLVWFVIRDPRTVEPAATTASSIAGGFARVIGIPAVWLQAVVVVCAYVGYKGFDNYSLFAVEAWEMTEVDAAAAVALASWMRPVAALAAGFLGDRFMVSRMTVILFVVMLGSQLYFAIATPVVGATWILVSNILVTCAAMFGLRGLYFALFEEARVPPAVTGTAVGIVSVVGFTPDIFVAYVGGILLDRSPGLAGHQHYFLFLAAFAALGVLASGWLAHLARRPAASGAASAAA